MRSLLAGAALDPLAAHALAAGPAATGDPFLACFEDEAAAPLAGAVATLDAVGRGDAAFALPPGSDPSLAGAELVHAFRVLDAATAAIQPASSPLGLRPVP